MQFYLSLPLLFVEFWFIKAPLALAAYFGSLNASFNQLFSLTLLLKTYFQPWKNEYRKGLVGFSRGMGMFIKTFVIAADVLVLVALLLIEGSIVLSFVLLPFLTVLLLFIH